MHLSKGFIAAMGAITLFLLISFVRQDAQCITRARRILRDMMLPIPTNVESEIACDPTPTSPTGSGQRRPVFDLLPEGSLPTPATIRPQTML